MHSCHDISSLVSKGLDKKLPFSDRLAIRVHITMCSHCRNFERQTKFIRKTAQIYIQRIEHFTDRNGR
ncbi:zf-HC2 domain-containing protein [Methylomonas koyamae]|uniref:zf-HC2 domain-containing protein n=1 Tax=Methylomonas koyamae TaxID=702114 RepID=UPI0011260E40|nr:zf-HC2 domain-containing protein [Methylomonas koyamae]TPQ29060.1 hypothetical protein C2U68_03660 [Methylomonas koyamae]